MKGGGGFLMHLKTLVPPGEPREMNFISVDPAEGRF
jgi:hypothetical protein